MNFKRDTKKLFTSNVIRYYVNSKFTIIIGKVKKVTKKEKAYFCGYVNIPIFDETYETNPNYKFETFYYDTIGETIKQSVFLIMKNNRITL